jgi:hypothetical protein
MAAVALTGACALGLVASVAAPAGAAPNQEDGGPCFPRPTGDYPPAPPVVDLQPALELAGGQLLPDAVGELELVGGEPIEDYCAILFSVPVTIAPTASDDAGAINLAPSVPLDFELAESHHLDIYGAERLVASFDFCVDREGAVVVDQATECHALASSGGTSLVRTGMDHLVDLLRLAAMAFAAGVFALYLRRRRIEEHALRTGPATRRARQQLAASRGRRAGRTPSDRSARGRPRA